MENLPPKSPTMAAENILSWPNFQPPPPHGMELNNNPNNPSWADDFVGFSASKRRTHRRSISDVSMAFVEEPPPMLVPGKGGPLETRLDDEAQFIMSMLNNELKETATGSASSSSGPPSSSSSAQKRCRTEEKPVKATEHQPPCQLHQSNEAINDPKRVKRILANRQSAQRSRVRKLQYISELERSMNRLQTEVSMLSPRVAFIDHQRMMLNVDNTALKSKIAALSHDKLFKDAHQEALKREIERLKQVYHQQSSVDTTAPAPDP